MRSRSANWRTQPMWSACSWVMKMASTCSASMPARPRRLPSSRMPRPQSTSRCVTRAPSLAWTMVALPELPLPRFLKRSVTGLLFQVFREQADDLLRGRRTFRGALVVQHRDHRLAALRLDGDAVLHRRRRIVLAEQLGDEGFLALAGPFDVAHEVRAGAAVAVFDRKTGAVEGKADAAPRAIEAFIHFQRGRARHRGDARRLLGLRGR